MRKQTLEIKDIFLIFLASVALLALASILLRLVIKTYYEKSTEAYQNKLMKNQKIRKPPLKILRRDSKIQITVV